MGARPTSMTVDVRDGEVLSLQGGLVTIELLHKSGRIARLRVIAPPEIAVKKMGALDAGSHQACKHPHRGLT